MKILLVMPKSLAKVSGYNVFPIGFAYVSASLKAAGHDVVTANLEYCEEDALPALRRLLEGHGFQALGISGLSRDYHKLKQVIDAVRQIDPDLPIVVGGGIMTADPETALAALGADLGVVGEGEVTVCELVAALETGQPLEGIPGLAILEEGRVTVTEARK